MNPHTRPLAWWVRAAPAHAAIAAIVAASASIHRKGEPRRALIAELHEDFEVELGDALDRLEGAARLALEHATGQDADRLRVALDKFGPAEG